jgi:hypothetical protein
MASTSSEESAGRVWQALLIGSVLGLSWLGMQIVHELGHVVAARTTGGEVVHVQLKPWSLSRTDVSPNPRPLVERWAGPVVGVVLPVAAWLAAHAAKVSWGYLLRFFAGFCLVANGAYIGCGAFAPVGDASDLLNQGTPAWMLAGFGLVAVPAGIGLWHGLGTYFGLGTARGAVNHRHAQACVVLLVVVVAAELLAP